MTKLLALRRSVLPWIAVGVVSLASVSCGGARQPIGVATLPGIIEVHEWPYWIDIPIEEPNVERIWRTVIDVVGERSAVAVMDRESGYMRTEWKSTEVTYGGNRSEERYTVRLQPQGGKIRFGLEVRIAGSNVYPSRIINTIQSPWTAVYRELQQRLVTMK